MIKLALCARSSSRYPFQADTSLQLLLFLLLRERVCTPPIKIKHVSVYYTSMRFGDKTSCVPACQPSQFIFWYSILITHMFVFCRILEHVIYVFVSSRF
jgi:hypothetical protein